jgi:hypothetical protein
MFENVRQNGITGPAVSVMMGTVVTTFILQRLHEWARSTAGKEIEHERKAADGQGGETPKRIEWRAAMTIGEVERLAFTNGLMNC